MNEKVIKFLNARKEEEDKNKQNDLVKLGFYEKVYSEKNEWSYDYPFEDSDGKYYKKVAIDVSDEEYDKIMKYAAISSKKNSVSVAIEVIAQLIYIGGFISGFIFGQHEVIQDIYSTHTSTEFSIRIAITYWSIAFISGTLLLGFAEIIKLLDKISKK